MADDDLNFEFEAQLKQDNKLLTQGEDSKRQVIVVPPQEFIGQQPGNYKKNFKKTVCSYWVKGMCMKGDQCGFLHQFDVEKMPICRNMLKFGECKELDCPFKHSTEEIKECNMYKLGFCIYGPACRYKHRPSPGPPPAVESIEAAKPREFRNVNDWVNQVNPGVIDEKDVVRGPPPYSHYGGGAGRGGHGGGGRRGRWDTDGDQDRGAKRQRGMPWMGDRDRDGGRDGGRGGGSQQDAPPLALPAPPAPPAGGAGAGAARQDGGGQQHQGWQQQGGQQQGGQQGWQQQEHRQGGQGGGQGFHPQGGQAGRGHQQQQPQHHQHQHQQGGMQAGGYSGDMGEMGYMQQGQGGMGRGNGSMRAGQGMGQGVGMGGGGQGGMMGGGVGMPPVGIPPMGMMGFMRPGMMQRPPY